jgi:conjugative transfer signal peptidase TraF
MKSLLNLLAVIILTMSVGVFALSIGFRLGGIYINTTPSLPVGFYRVVDEPVTQGAYVAFCPPQRSVFDIALARNYIHPGDCPGGYGLLLKQVLAQAGDRVAIDKSGMVVNGQRLAHSAPLMADTVGFMLPSYQMDARVLAESEYLLVSDVNPQSFDARYFGLVTREQIIHVVRPVLTWGF